MFGVQLDFTINLFIILLFDNDFAVNQFLTIIKLGHYYNDLVFNIKIFIILV